MLWRVITAGYQGDEGDDQQGAPHGEFTRPIIPGGTAKRLGLADRDRVSIYADSPRTMVNRFIASVPTAPVARSYEISSRSSRHTALANRWLTIGTRQGDQEPGGAGTRSSLTDTTKYPQVFTTLDRQSLLELMDSGGLSRFTT